MSGQDPIAIVGIGCRFPGGVAGPDAFWQFLVAGTDAVGEISPERWDMRRYYHPDPTRPGKLYCSRAAFLSEIDQFDASFFGIPPGEASRMDPQQRLLLEVCWEALEDGGLVPQQLAGSHTGVFIGVSSNDYGMLQIQDINSVNAYTNAGQTCSIASNRISYLFDFRGPSFSVDAACSSSLVALHLACQSLVKGECSLALAGGVSVVLEPALSVGLSKAYMLSPHGQCRAFDADADGYVRGEGAGVVVLKPLSQALSDGDPIYAVLLATGVNQDGRTPGLLQPSRSAQETLLRQVYAEAGIAPSQVVYVEAHGTGTTVGDFMEGNALGTVLGRYRPKGEWLRIGSAKTQIGHLEAASGIASLIKSALILKHQQIPANLHFHTPNPQIPFEKLRLKVQQELEPLPVGAGLPIVGVNNFGFGGTNAHAVLQAMTPSKEQQSLPSHDTAFLLPLSARHPQALRALAQSYLELISPCSSQPCPSLRDLCFTASTRRDHHAYRLGLVAQSHADLAEKLQAFLDSDPPAGMASESAQANKTPEMVFVFAGNGPQWWAMGRQLLAEDALFRDTVERCDRLLSSYTGWSLLDELLVDETQSRMHRTDVAQSALFAIQVGLAAVWKSWGIEPQAVIGHSMGEVAAAHVAGILSLEEAIKVVYHRSRLQELTAGMGKMAAVSLSEQEALALLSQYNGQVTLASINSPYSVTLAGDAAALKQIVELLDEQDIFARLLPLNYAFHCSYLDPIREELLTSLRDIHPQQARIRFISTFTGREIIGTECDALYWWESLRLPVQFSDGIQQLLENSNTIFLEIGPHPVLAHYLAECLQFAEHEGTMLPSLRRKENDHTTLLGTLATLYTRGCSIRWDTFATCGCHVPLPSYPWQRESYWNAPKTAGQSPRGILSHPLLGSRLRTTPAIWENTLDQQECSILSEHLIDDAAIISLAGYAEIALVAAKELFDKDSYVIEDMKVHQPLALSDSSSLIVQTLLSGEEHSFQISSHSQDEQAGWMTHVTGYIRDIQPPSAAPFAMNDLRQRCLRELSADDFYQECLPRNVHYSSRFQCVERVYVGEREALAVIRWPEIADAHEAHLVFLDNCVQTMFALIPSNCIPVSVERLSIYKQPLSTHLSCSVRLVAGFANAFLIDAVVVDEDGLLVIEIHNLRVQIASFLHSQESETPLDCLYEARWVLSPHATPAPETSPFPLPSQLVTQLQPALEEMQQELAATTYELAPVHQLCVAYMLAALLELGWTSQAGDRFTLSSLREQTGIAPQYERLLCAWCMFLTRMGVLKEGEDGWEVIRLPERTNPEGLLPPLLRAYPGAHADFLLLSRCGRNLPAILTGKMDSLSLLFSEEAWPYTEHFYESGIANREANCCLQAAVKQIIRQLPKTQKLRILEIGAGTGGTSAWLLPVLPADQIEYVFTDVSETFLQRAQQKYQQYPFVRCQLLDIELDPRQQGFEEHGFDLVIAANVFHMTHDLQETLRHTLQLLSSEGLLALIEETNPFSPSLLLISGLLEGNGQFQETKQYPVQPLLTQALWATTLQEIGFSETALLSAKPEGMPTDLALFLARGPHVARPVEPVRLASAEPARGWMLFADGYGVAVGLAEKITAQGGVALLVEKGEAYQRSGKHHFALRPGSAEDMQRLLETLYEEGLLCEHIVYLWGAEHLEEESTCASLQSLVVMGCLGVVTLVQQLTKMEWHPLPQLWVVTCGAQVPDATEAPAIEQAPLYGLSRVIHHEHPEMHCTLIDIGALQKVHGGYVCDAEVLQALYEEIHTQEEESEVLLHSQARYVNRIRRIALGSSLQASEVSACKGMAFRLCSTSPGPLDHLILQTVPRLAPKAGEVEIAVEAAGLNFKDVMSASGVMSSAAVEEGYADASSLGQDCAGRITALGEGVSDFQVGDEVIAIGRHCLGSFVRTDAAFVARKPASISVEEGATIPFVFTTAYYVLHHLAHVLRGERVLIHGASGGIGLAAIQIVQQAGGEVFATAGSQEKREYLRSLGVRHVLDSRSLDFADDILQITHGEGVDIVLNSLSGEAAAKSLALLRPFGRFLQLSKRDLLENKKVGLRPFQRGLSYFAIDMNRLWRDNPALMAQILHEVHALFEQGVYRPLPYRLYQLAQVRDAFRSMQQSHHIGKIVVSLLHPSAQVYHMPQTESSLFRSDASYLIIGGVSGFGLETAKWMVRGGVRHLVLAGLSGISTPKVKEEIEALRATGTSVSIVKLDVTQEEDVALLFENLRTNFPPLRGVLHAAANFDDRDVLELDEATMIKVMTPKVLGAWNLHRQTRNLPLDFFVLYSSVTVLVGNNSQGSYVAGNAFMDALALSRRAQGLPATAVEWGAVAKVGVVAQNKELSDILTRKGLYSLTPEQNLNLLEKVLHTERPLVAIASMDWQRLDAFLLTVASRTRCLELLSEEKQEAPEHPEVLGNALLSAPPEERQARVQAHLTGALAKLLGKPAAAFASQSAADLGLDSLMAMELRQALRRDLEVDIPVMKILRVQSIASMATMLTELMMEKV